MSIEKNISRLFEEINSSKKFMLQSLGLNEDIAFSSPLNRKLIVTSGFGPRWGSLHNGVDLIANAENVKSPADGIVITTAADQYPCGGTIIIKHSGGYQTGYCHMQKINVKRGQLVRKGDIIGITGGGVGDPGRGRSDGPHLHFTLRKDDVPIDPMKFLNKDTSEIGDILGGKDDLGLTTVLGGGALAASSTSKSDSEDNTFVKSDEFQFMSKEPPSKSDEFIFMTDKKEKKISENIEKIKKML